jgi:hypothetical protein
MIRFKQLLGILTINEYDSMVMNENSKTNIETLLNADSFRENHRFENN